MISTQQFKVSTEETVRGRKIEGGADSSDLYGDKSCSQSSAQSGGHL